MYNGKIQEEMKNGPDINSDEILHIVSGGTSS
jgi:hypothetical protein